MLTELGEGLTERKAGHCCQGSQGDWYPSRKRLHMQGLRYRKPNLCMIAFMSVTDSHALPLGFGLHSPKLCL